LFNRITKRSSGYRSEDKSERSKKGR
jgi:hypothetical protein